MKKILLFLCLLIWTYTSMAQEGKNTLLQLKMGVLPKGRQNAITDVQGVKVGHTTVTEGDSIRTGVTAIIPHSGNLFRQKVPAAVYVGNGFGKLAGSTQVAELGNIETPLILTNTLTVPTAMDAVIEYTLKQPGNNDVQSVNAVVGETNDGWLNDIRARKITKAHVLEAIAQADTGAVQQGNVGAGTGTVCFGFKGGIGTASRVLPLSLGGYTVGVLVQTNFGGVLQVDGVPVGEELKQFSFSDKLLNNVDGSCMIVVATDAPLDNRNLQRLAKRAFMGLAKTGGIASNGSGDYVIAFSTAYTIAHQPENRVNPLVLLHNDYTSPVFMAAIEATEEAIINSLLHAATTTGYKQRTIQALPHHELIRILKKYNRLP